nr:MAG TPA: hypothetical protein [Caudoviricetes sp.]
MLKSFEQIHSNTFFYPCQQQNSIFLNFLLEFLFKMFYNENIKTNKELFNGA